MYALYSWYMSLALAFYVFGLPLAAVAKLWSNRRG